MQKTYNFYYRLYLYNNILSKLRIKEYLNIWGL